MYSKALAIKIRSPRRVSELVKQFLRQQWKRCVQHYCLLESIRAERAALAKMTDAELRDLGIHRADADHESARDYWDVPTNRLR